MARSASPDELTARPNNALATLTPASSAALAHRDSSTPNPQPTRETIVIPPGGFLTHDKAEAAFIHLLKREGVDETSTWDQTMRKIIMDPLYKALDTLAQKKTAFEKVYIIHVDSALILVQYTSGIVEDRRADKDARIVKLRPILHRVFAASRHIKGSSTIKTADQVFSHDKHWREAKPDERRLILEEFVTDLRNREEVSRSWNACLTDRSRSANCELAICKSLAHSFDSWISPFQPGGERRMRSF